MRLIRKASAAAGPAESLSTSSSALSIRSASSISVRSLSGPITKMLGKAAASLKRRRDDIDEHTAPQHDHDHDHDRRNRAAVLFAATEEVVRRSTADNRPAHVVAQHDSGLIPGGWDEVGLSASSSSTALYPALPSLRAPMPESLPAIEQASTSTASSSAPAPNPPVFNSAVPPSITTDAFESAIADLNARLLAKGKSNANLQDAVDSFRAASASASASAASSSATNAKKRGTSTADRFKSAHEKMFKKSDSIASHYATIRASSKTKKVVAALTGSSRKSAAAGKTPTAAVAPLAGPSTDIMTATSTAPGAIEPTAKRTRIDPTIATTTSPRKPAPAPTPLDLLAQPKHVAPSPLKRTTATLNNKNSMSTLKPKASTATLRAQPSTSSLRSAVAAAGSQAGPAPAPSVRFGPKQIRTFTSGTSEESTEAQQGSGSSTPLATSSPPQAAGPSAPTSARPMMPAKQRSGSAKMLDIFATPPRRIAPLPQSRSTLMTASLPRSTALAAAAAVRTSSSPLKRVLGSAAMLLGVFATPPRAAPAIVAGAKNRTGAAQTSSQASRTAGRFHPYKTGGASAGVSSARPKGKARAAPAPVPASAAQLVASKKTAATTAASTATVAGPSRARGLVNSATTTAAGAGARGTATTRRTAATAATTTTTSTRRGPAPGAVAPGKKTLPTSASLNATSKAMPFPAVPQTSTPPSTLASAVAAAVAEPAAAIRRRPHIDRGAIMRRARAAAEAGAGAEVDSAMGSVDVEMDVHGDGDGEGNGEDAPMEVDAEIEAEQERVTTPYSQDEESSSASGSGSMDEREEILQEDVDAPTRPMAVGNRVPSSSSARSTSTSTSITKAARPAPVPSSTMLTSSNSVPSTVTLSTGLSARLPSKKTNARTAGGTRDGPLPLPVVPPLRSSGTGALRTRTNASNAAAGKAGAGGKARVASGSTKATGTGTGMAGGKKVSDENAMLPPPSRPSTSSSLASLAAKDADTSMRSSKSIDDSTSTSTSTSTAGRRVAFQVAELNGRSSSLTASANSQSAGEHGKKDSTSSRAGAKAAVTVTSTRRKAPATKKAAMVPPHTAAAAAGEEAAGRMTRASARLAAKTGAM
ncbi:unnamed protein product [Tilletia controversa]|nr:unnamed protein product [Tilletia controversa]CAD6918014.1 unnamed protein product [Tilletia controversa]